MRPQLLLKYIAFAAVMIFMAPAALVLSTPSAVASEPTGDHGEQHADHGHNAAASHDAPADDAHAEGGHHGFTPLGDDDHDGVVNLLDGDHDLAGEFMGIKIPVLGKVGFHLINLLLLLGVLVAFGRRPVGDFLKNRSVGIAKELADAAEVETKSRDAFNALEARINSFDDEADKLRADASNTAQTETERIVAKAHDASTRIADSAQRAIRDEKARAIRQLRAEAVELAVQLAETRLRNEIRGSDRQALAEDFLTSLDADGVS
ncbi:MAG: F-type H+-transporting ATPase subunit b [Kiritimatiellia bacterium]|jgi:F-type H+-transporting ATPase subunit b